MHSCHFDQSILDQITEGISRAYYHNIKEIEVWHSLLFPDHVVQDAQFLREDPYGTPAIVDKLFRAVNNEKSIWVRSPLGSRGASLVKDAHTEEILFIVKKTDDRPNKGGFNRSEKPSNFGISEETDEGLIEREKLYYDLDRDGFAGVPLTILMSLKGIYCSFQVYIQHIALLSHLNNASKQVLKPSLRRCTIHQIRTVNMDPNSDNVLIKSITPNGAIPVDGGFSLPFKISNCKATEFDSSFLDEPFHDEEIEYIQKIDLDSDSSLIKSALDEEIETINCTIKIFRAANLILKKAIEYNGEITLHDVVAIRKRSFFAYIVAGADEEDILLRINRVLNELITIKSTIQSNHAYSTELACMHALYEAYLDTK